MSKKFVIVVADNNEVQYCRAVCKLADATLVDDDFDLQSNISNSTVAAINYYLEEYSGYVNKPILILPYNVV